MAENEGVSRATVLCPRTIALPSHSSVENLFIGGAVSENDPFSECWSFSQLLAEAMASPVAVGGRRPGLLPETSTEVGSEDGGEMDLLFKQNRPLSLVTAESSMFTVPPGLSPASLLGSPGYFSPGRLLGISHQQALALVTAQAAQSQSYMHLQTEYQSSILAYSTASLVQHPSLSSNVTTHEHNPSLTSAPKSTMMESSELSHSDQRFQFPSLTIDKPPNDGYNWRKYGQKQVKCSEYLRSYYKCTYLNCPVKKKVEHSIDGQVTEIIHKGHHNHQAPQSDRRAKESGNSNGNLNFQGDSEVGSWGQSGNLSRSKESLAAPLLSRRDHKASQAAPEQLSGTSDSEEMGDADTTVDDGDNEPNPKRRRTGVSVSEPPSHRTVTEPRIIVQATGKVDLLDDGYGWRKYGQKVVKGNPNPRSYYKCSNTGCIVRKHVERASTNSQAIITTYEGKHNHDMPAAKSSRHNTTNSNVPRLKPHTASEKHALLKKTDLGNTNQQPVACPRLEE